MNDLVITRATVAGYPEPVDVTITEGRISHIGSADRSSAPSIDAAGGALIPGLCDHHVHILAMAAADASVDLRAGGDLAGKLREAASARPPDAWIRATGYHDPANNGFDRADLDEFVPDHPVRVQHRSGALWILNTAALRHTGLLAIADRPTGVELDDRGEPTGRLWRLDEWLRDHIPAVDLDLAGVANTFKSNGVTAVTDATPSTDLNRLAAIRDLRITVMGAPDLDPTNVPPGLAFGPAKIVLGDHDLPPLDEVIESVKVARKYDRPVAVHCVTREALVLALTAIQAAGPTPGDRIEHASVVGPDLFPLMRRTGVTVVTQPNFVAERGDDYLREVPIDDHADLWRCGSLLADGIPVAAGTDAPHGRPDPWALIRAASERRTPSGARLGTDERVTRHRALDLLMTDPADPGGPPRRVAVGGTADLCLLHEPLRTALENLPNNPVRMTIRGGRILEGKS